ncbi:hypothetical protein C8F01DRAFT_1232034 [Mycena amicta]|nr:hypothetical protein C8F01DRAFT_1232034 [Mycena amicta]
MPTSRCPYCKHPVKNFSSIGRHITNSAACRKAETAKMRERRQHVPASSMEVDEPNVEIPPMPPGLDNPHDFADLFDTPLRESTPPPPQPIGVPPRPSVEEVMDQDDPQNLHRYVRPFLHPVTGTPTNAGRPLRAESTPFELLREQLKRTGESKYTPFKDDEEWEVTEWLTRRVNQTGTDEYLKLKTTRRQNLSFHNNRAFLKKVDLLPTGPEWVCHIVTIVGDRVENGVPMQEEVELWIRDPIETIKEIISDPSLKKNMAYAPERIYCANPASEDDRIIDEMWTADEWYELQERLRKEGKDDACVCPVIMATDKTKLTNFGGDKAAYPAYLTIGNVSKEIRRKPSSHATRLVAYLPAAKLSCFSSDDAQAVATYRLFHHSMSVLLEPLIAAGTDGVEMVCADGFVRRVFPILSAYVADHPEQCLVACCKQNRCPRCLVHRNDRGDNLRTTKWRDKKTTLQLLDDHKNRRRVPLFDEYGLHPVYRPFWANLPHCDIFTCITPDILHQLHKGVFKDHLVTWCIAIVGKEEFDARFKAMNAFAGLRRFKKGISGVTQWTGKEFKEMQRVFVGVMTGAVNDKILTIVKALIDFIYYAQLQSHTNRTLDALQAALDTFHTHKQVIIDLDVRDHFNIPKFHSMQHYIDAIRRRGSCDGFNTESPERLHIDFAKNAYNASNGRDYTIQMTIWLRRREAIAKRSRFIVWFDSQQPVAGGSTAPSANEDVQPAEDEPELMGKLAAVTYTIAKFPAAPRRTVAQIHAGHLATDLTVALTTFIRQRFLSIHILPGPFDFYDVFHQIKLSVPRNRYLNPEERVLRIRAHPGVPAAGRKSASPAVFDTALVIADPAQYTPSSGLTGLQPARIRLIFRLPSHLGTYPHPLAYIEWYTPLSGPDPVSGMYTTRPSTRNHHANTAVISLDRIVRSCHLVGQSRRTLDRRWTAYNVLDMATAFYVNPYIHLDTFTRQMLVS